MHEASTPAGEKGLLLDAEGRIEAMLYAIESDDMTQDEVHELQPGDTARSSRASTTRGPTSPASHA
jgi:hypothetical protein